VQQICKQTGKAFEIPEEDLRFYEKINVPIPTLCPEERERRRWAWRGKNFFIKNCDKCGNRAMSWFPPGVTEVKTYCEYCFKSDEYDATEYSRDFDFNRPFFEQFAELQKAVPRHISNSTNNENSEYIICAHKNKNCYLVDEIDGSKDCYFGYNIQYCKDVVEGLYVRDSEIGYNLIKAEGCYAVFYSKTVFNCSSSAFILNCRSAKNCLFCCNLVNKQYHIFNEPVSKEEFEQRWKEIFDGSLETLDKNKKIFEEFLKTQDISKKVIINCEDCTGNYLSNCKNVKDSFCIDNCRDCRYCSDIHYSRDCYDTNIYEGELMYECTHVGPKGYGQFFSQLAWFSHNVYYCIDLRSCEDCFGCIGLKKRKYCIFNKQYSKEEYFELKDRIIEYMRGTKEYGEFFPIEMSPFPYNITMAQRFFPLTKDDVLSRGGKWREEEDKKDFKIMDSEKIFYEKHGIPLPIKHPLLRIEDLWAKMGARR
jgi:hypothetical protein